MNSQLFDGYFLEAFYEEYVTDGTYKDPIRLRCKQNDEGTQGVSSGGKATKMLQDSQGRPIFKSTFTVKVLKELPYKGRDRFTITRDKKTYTIIDFYEDYSSVNTLNNLQFKRIKNNLPIVLVLGEKI